MQRVLGLTRERPDFPSSFAAFRWISGMRRRLRSGERKIEKVQSAQALHFASEFREQIGLLKVLGHSIGAIARAIRRPKSTISRELSRNRLPSGRYSPLHAASRARVRDVRFRPAVFVDGSTTIKQAGRAMRGHNNNTLLVREGDAVGIITGTGFSQNGSSSTDTRFARSVISTSYQSKAVSPRGRTPRVGNAPLRALATLAISTRRGNQAPSKVKDIAYIAAGYGVLIATVLCIGFLIWMY